MPLYLIEESLPKMFDTQENMLDEQYQDWLEPAVKEIIEKAGSTDSKEVCAYLILMALNSTLDKDRYAELVTEYLGNKDTHRWARERLIALNGAFQPDNDRHLFIKFVIDKRFYNAHFGMSMQEWISACKKESTEYYINKIHHELKTSYPSIYEKALYQVNIDSEDPILAGDCCRM